MGKQDSDELFNNTKKKIDSILNEKYESYFAVNSPEKWAKLSDEQKNAYINKLKELVEQPKYRKVTQEFKYLESLKFNLGILFLGVLLGISGNLVANLLDRYFLRFGYWYDLSIGLSFVLSIFLIERIFVRKNEENLMNEPLVKNLLELGEEFDNL